MADSNRIVFPDELERIKRKVADETKDTKTNTVEKPPEVNEMKPFNVITVPPNCPPGQQRGADGVCRDVF